MFNKLLILSGLVASVACMVLHHAPVPLYLPIQHQQSTPNYNIAYEVNDAHTGDFKRLHESRNGDVVIGQYSILQPDGLTRTVNYRADDLNGFSAVVNNVGVPKNDQNERHEEGRDNKVQTQSGERPQPEPWQISSDQQVTAPPPTVSHAALIHHILQNL